MKKSKLSFTIGVLMVYLSSLIYLIDSLKKYNLLMLGLGLFLLLISYFFNKAVIISYNVKQTIYYMLYIFTSVLASIINSDIKLFFATMLMLLLYIFLSMISIENNNSQLNIISKSARFISILFILVSILSKSISMKSYRGIFYNSNAFGSVAATTFVITFSNLVHNLNDLFKSRAKKSVIIVQLILSTLLFFLVIISSSRGSFVSVIIVISFTVLHSFISRIKTSKIHFETLLKKVLYFSWLFLILMYLVQKLNLINIINYAIIDKFKLKELNILDGREYVWKMTFEQRRLFGHGRNYFTMFGIGAHSTFISILGQFGILPLVFFLLFLTETLKSSIAKVREVNDKNRYLPMLSTVIFISLSISEGMMLKSSMILMFLTINVYNKNKIIIH